MKARRYEGAGLRRIAYRLAALAVAVGLAKLAIAAKAGFRPDQLRVPGGSPHGGRWTDGATPVSSRGPEADRRVAGRWTNVTPAQEARLAVSRGEMQAAVSAVRKLDRDWKPTPQVYATIEGQIAANHAIAREARTRIFQLTTSPRLGGPYAAEWIPSPPGRRPNKAEQNEINRIGRTFGCHWCGNKDPGTKLGNFIGDHQIPRSLGKPTRIYPHCATCSSSQGGIVKRHKE